MDRYCNYWYGNSVSLCTLHLVFVIVSTKVMFLGSETRHSLVIGKILFVSQSLSLKTNSLIGAKLWISVFKNVTKFTSIGYSELISVGYSELIYFIRVW